MCGFVLAHFQDSRNVVNKQKVLSDSCEKYIRTRGPTYQESYASESLFCYQSVLSIQGNKIRGTKTEPVGSKKFVLYNGEIYNYLKDNKSTSDTEILNDQHNNNNIGGFLNNIDGMYAICAVERINENQNIIDLYRDLVGEKHLWYLHNEEVLLVSSIPAIIIEYLKKFSTIEIDISVIKDYLKRRHLISPEFHPIKGIKQVMPGAHIRINTSEWNNQIIERRFICEYFDENLHRDLKQLSSKEITAFTNNEFKKSMTSMNDVCSGNVKSSSIFSGGIDSSLTTHFLNNIFSEKSFDVYTLLLNEKDSVAPNSREMIKKINRRNSINHHEIICEIENYYSSLIRAIDILGSPINTHSIPSSYIVAQHASNDGNQVLYGGEGADELFMGYGCYLNDINSESIYNCNAGHFSSYSAIKISEEIQNEINSDKQRFKDLIEYLSCDEVNLKSISEAYTDYSIQLPNVGLLSTDTINSDLGIECRTPFTRKPLLRLGLSMPIKQKLNKKTKIPLKNIFTKIFGDENLYPKIGFAGYPNECAKFLPEIKNWYVFKILDIKYNDDIYFTRDEFWKLTNVEFFLRKVIYNEDI